METHRVAYYNRDGEPREAIVDAENADDAIAQLDDYGSKASVTSVGPAAVVLPDDDDVNDGAAEDLTLAQTREELDAPHAGPHEGLDA